MTELDFSSWICPLPFGNYPKIVLAHGGGGLSYAAKAAGVEV